MSPTHTYTLAQAPAWEKILGYHIYKELTSRIRGVLTAQ